MHISGIPHQLKKPKKETIKKNRPHLTDLKPEVAKLVILQKIKPVNQATLQALSFVNQPHLSPVIEQRILGAPNRLAVRLLPIWHEFASGISRNLKSQLPDVHRI